MPYNVGSKIRCRAVFKNVDGQLADPVTITAKIKKPSGSVVTFLHGQEVELVNDSPGIYHLDLALDQAGTWWHRWIGTGDLSVAEVGYFTVRPERVR